jgi:excisionase family DNA binding protein
MIDDLATHPRAYVSVGELAGYWGIGRKQIYKQLDAGTLEAIRLGPRLYRISTAKALEFERKAKLKPADRRPRASGTRRSVTSKAS